MKHINKNLTKIGKEYRQIWKTDDPNIIKETFTVCYEIHLDKLDKMIAHTKHRIDMLKEKIELSPMGSDDLSKMEEGLAELEEIKNTINLQLKEN